MPGLPWSERINMFQINPDAATRDDIARLAEELFYSEEAKITYRALLAMVLHWRNFDGDGITDPLRQDIVKTLEFYKTSNKVRNI